MPPDKDPNLENELRGLGAHVEYPPTPDLAGSLRERLRTEENSAATPLRPRLWWLAAAALVVLAALPVLSLVVGNSMGGMGGTAGGVGGGEVSIGERAADGPEVGDEPTDLSAGAGRASSEAGAASVSSGASALAGQNSSASVSPERSRLGEGLGLGTQVPLRAARERSDGPILYPRSPGLGKPDELYDRADATGLTALYEGRYREGSRSRLPVLDDTRVGLILTQTPGDVGAAYLPGGTVEGDGLETVSINGEKGYWVPASGAAPEVYRSAGLLSGVLLWEREGQALRIEADVTRKEAVRIAESVR